LAGCSRTVKSLLDSSPPHILSRYIMVTIQQSSDIRIVHGLVKAY